MLFRTALNFWIVVGERCVEWPTSVDWRAPSSDGLGVDCSFSFSEDSRALISASRSLRTSCKRIISFPMLTADRCSVGVLGLLRLERDMDKFGRCDGECETELLLPWLDTEASRDLAEESSCESESDCDTG